MTDLNSRKTVLEAAVLLLPAAGYFAHVTSLPHVVLITGSILFFSILFWKPLKITDRLIIYSAVASLAITILADSAFPLPEDKFIFLTAMLHPEILVPLLLYLAAMLTITRHRPLILGMGAAAVVTAIAFCCEQEALLNHHLASFAADKPKALYLLWGGMLLTMVLLFWHLRKTYKIGRGVTKEIIAWASLGIIFAGTWGLYQQDHAIRESIRQLENVLLDAENKVKWQSRKQGIFSVDSLKIDDFLTPEMLKDEAQIVFQAVGKIPPGYLRGRGFTMYKYGGTWSADGTARQKLQRQDGPGLVKEGIFFLPRKHKNPACKWTILPVNFFLRDIVFYPASTAELHMLGEKAYLTASGTIQVNGGTLHAGYTALAENNLDSGAPGELKEQEYASYLQVPRELRPILREIRYVTGNQSFKTDEECYRKLLLFFRDHFRYSLNKEIPDRDPVEHFLQHSRRGHCQLYASAMVLLLRTCHIPARYATGFICEEPHRSGRSYIARLGNAHAWVEAYDRDQKKWVLLDPTPPTPPIPPRDGEDYRQWAESFTLGFHEFLSELRRGHIAEAFALLLENAFRLLGGILGSLWTWLAAGTGLAAGLFILRRRFIRKPWLHAAPGKWKIIRQYWRFLIRMWFCRKIPFFAHPTALEMEKILRAAPLPPDAQQTALEFLQTYRKKRFKP